MTNINFEPELINYIKERTLLGYPEYDTRKNLAIAGWKADQIDSAIKYCNESISKEPKQDTVDEEFLNGWSISSIILGPIYFFFSHMKKNGFLCFIPLYGWFIQIYNFFKGRRKSYETGKWSSFEKFEKTQRRLDIWSFFIMINMLIAFMIGIIFLIFYPESIQNLSLRFYKENIINDLETENIDTLYEKSTDSFKKDFPKKEDLLRFLGTIDISSFEADFYTSYKDDALICGYYYEDNYESTKDLKTLNFKLVYGKENDWKLDKIDTRIEGCNLEKYSREIGDMKDNPLSKFFPEKINIGENELIIDSKIRSSESYSIFNSYGLVEKISNLKNSIWVDYFEDDSLKIELFVANYEERNKKDVIEKAKDYFYYLDNYAEQDFGFENEIENISSDFYLIYYIKGKKDENNIVSPAYYNGDFGILGEILFIDYKNNILSGSFIYENKNKVTTSEELDKIIKTIIDNLRNN